jgi:tRNA pseudouridine55 synthase
VRTLCHDVGAALGCGGCLFSLRRTEAAGFSLARAVTLEQLQSRGAELLEPLDAYFAPYPAYTVPTAGREVRVRNGAPITDESLADGTYRVYGADGAFLCLSRARGGVLTAVKNFF